MQIPKCARRARAAGSEARALHTMAMMTGVPALYEALGFARDPARDFPPAPGVTVRAHRPALRP